MDSFSPLPCPNTVTVRRNPHRSARPRATPATLAPQLPIPHSSSSTVSEVLSFPTQEILSMDISKAKPVPVSEDLRVFLRIRPLLSFKRWDRNNGLGGDQNSKPRSKNAWPQNPVKNAARERGLKKKKNTEVCITINNSQSVTLSPPLALQESNRTRSEVYDGFSHVFSEDSSQEEVYEMMVRPLVDDFLRGKSGMLAALGPSGSGKTHTVFGSNKDPGVVPRALRQIFRRIPASGYKSLRSFFISIFEISSERGKAEKLLDLSPNGGDLSMQQSTLRGLQELAICDAREAESLIAQAMQKRATATTNTNSQSSRSQCIINIRGVAEKFNGGGRDQANDVVLSIVDLAGAEREKRTGNQGERLLESNFINNTSMVFSACLRSLLEHQKNPKKPLQKHFQNSLLTKYLRDYLEGKKRMTLILTVKPGEEDYRDTSYLLRQASPYMEIKFNNVEEPSTIPHNKRNFQALSRIEPHKRMRLTGFNTCAIGGKSIQAENGPPEEGSIQNTEAPRIDKVDMSSCAPSNSGCVDSGQGERNHQIMQNFCKALWNVLKQYNAKLKVANTRCLQLEKELNDIKSCCTCSHRKPVEVTLVEVDMDFKARVQLDGLQSSNIDEPSYLRGRDSNITSKKLEATPEKDQDIFSQEGALRVGNEQHIDATIMQSQNNEQQIDASTSYLRGCDSNSTPKRLESTPEKDQDIFSQEQVKGRALCVDNKQDIDATIVQSQNNEQLIDATIVQSQNNEQLIDATVKSSDVGEVSASCLGPENSNQRDHQICGSLSGSGHSTEYLCESTCVRVEESYPNAAVAGSVVNSSQSLVMHRKDSCSSVELDQLTEEDEELLNLPTLPKEDGPIKGCNEVIVLDGSTKLRKPKRRLLPASSILLRDVITLDSDDDNEKPKGRKKAAAEERKITQGSISLLRLLQSNLHI